MSLYIRYQPIALGGGGGSSITTGNLTDVGTDGIVITGGTGAVVGSGTQIAQHVADAAHNGYLSSTDWSTFNSKQAALTIGNFTDAGTDGIVVTGGTGAVIGTGTSIAQHVADASHNGYLSSTDWSTFNAKQAALTIGNLTDAGTDGITVTGGTGSVIGTGTSLSQHVADTTHNGYLSSTDWNTFNGKQSTITIGALDAQAVNANGLALVSNVLSSQSADATHPGMVNLSAQAFAGAKTFNNNLVGLGTLGIGTSTPDTDCLVEFASNTGATLFATSYGAAGEIEARYANGTKASPTATTTGNNILILGGRGYGTTGFAPHSSANFNTYAAETFTDSAQGAYASIQTTPVGGLALNRLERIRINADGTVGIGTASPTDYASSTNPILAVVSDTVNTAFAVASYGTGPSATMRGFTANGTKASPTATQSGDTLLVVGGHGYGTTGFSAASRANITMSASQTWTDANQGTQLLLKVTPNNTNASVVALTLSQDQSATFANTVTGTRFISNIATGTAPLAITSTTLVPNLYVARAVLADSVTTNANLTGVITSSGNATSIASQTGTGTKFVVDTSPTLVTPVIGAATGTSLSLTGLLTTFSGGDPATNSSSLTAKGNIFAGVATTVQRYSSGRDYIVVQGNAGLGALELSGVQADADQAIQGSVQFIDTNSTAGDKGLALILGMTNGATANNRGGQIDFRIKPNGGSGPTSRMVLNETGLTVVSLAGTGSRAVVVDANGLMSAPVSDYRLKRDVVPLSAVLDPIDTIKKLKGVSFYWDTTQPRVEHFGDQEEIGFIAQDVEKVVPQVVRNNADGFKSMDYDKLVPLLLESIKILEARLSLLEGTK